MEGTEFINRTVVEARNSGGGCYLCAADQRIRTGYHEKDSGLDL